MLTQFVRSTCLAVLLFSPFVSDAAPAKKAPQPAKAAQPTKGIELDAPIPVGPQVKVGKLANGLTYYIQKNARPERRVELRLVVKAGSILEDEDQQGLALRVVAEGVETVAQRDFLGRIGCAVLQGYLYSPPVPAREMQELLQAGRVAL